MAASGGTAATLTDVLHSSIQVLRRPSVVSRRPVVGGNWKMNLRRSSAMELAEAIGAGAESLAECCDILLAPPFVYLDVLAQVLADTPIELAAQDVYPGGDGAVTGEVNVAMLADLGVSTVIVGHSERRHVIGESDALIAAKLRAVLDHGLKAVLCVGETEDQRDAGDASRFTLHQLESALAGVEATAMARLIIAYEPVWAIGTGRTATPDDAQEMHSRIRAALESQYDGVIASSIRIQYGGSVKPANAGDLFGQPDVDGGLVGGASLAADDFLQIARAAAATSVEFRKAEQS